jgi:RNA polymerase sigma-70 factor (ECF subfamily)
MTTRESSSAIDLETMEPNELVRRAAGGCADAFAELSRRFRPRLMILLRHHFRGNDFEVEDIVQEALAKAFLHLDRFDTRYRFSTWLYTIATRTAHDRARAQRRRPPHVSLSDADCVCGKSSHTQEAHQQHDEAGNLWRIAKCTLSEAQYTAMWLRYGEDLSPVEIAAVMRKSRVGVRVLLHRARLALVAEIAKHDRKMVDQLFAGPGCSRSPLVASSDPTRC